MFIYVVVINIYMYDTYWILVTQQHDMVQTAHSEFAFAQIVSNKVMQSPSGSGVNTPSSRDCAHHRGLIPNASCRTGGGHGVRVRFCLRGSEVGSGISTARGADSSPGTARCKLVWCTEPYKGTILYVEFSSSHTLTGLDSIDCSMEPQRRKHAL